MEPAVPYRPATLAFNAPDHVANWRPLVQWILAIPHFLILYGLRVLSEAIAFISWFAIVFTGSLPEGLANIQMMYTRYEIRTYTYVAFMREEYPPFNFATTASDGGEDPRTRVDFAPTLTDRNRLTVAFRIILVIPHVIVLAFLGIAAAIVTLIAFFAVLFTGRWPEGMRSFVLDVLGWYLRVATYFLLLTDEYPPFTLAR